jgi:NAD(P)-dependent dehydrogenase (short-subunit alcohol dehydrogenase family)
MRVLVIGATGTIGTAVCDALATKHQLVKASRNGEVKVDLGDPKSIRDMFEKVGKVDAVVSCAGGARMAPLEKLSDDDLNFTLSNKLMGQVNVVRFGVPKVNDGGVFVLTAGIYSQKPPPNATALAIANGALESFARAAALDLPRRIRIVTISPPFLTESAIKMGMPNAGLLSTVENAKAYVKAVEGNATGTVVYTVPV